MNLLLPVGISFYTFQAIGYSLIAIGAAKVMGFSLMQNFRRPYFAQSIKEFWVRWHILDQSQKLWKILSPQLLQLICTGTVALSGEEKMYLKEKRSQWFIRVKQIEDDVIACFTRGERDSLVEVGQVFRILTKREFTACNKSYETEE